MINLFPEVIPEGGHTPAFLNRAPGLKLEVAVGTGPIRGLWTFNGYAYVASGNTLYKLDSEYNITTLGTLANDGPVSMTDDGTYLAVACNGPTFYYNSTTEAFGEITDVDFPGALTISYLGGYFVFIEPNSQRVWTAELLDPSSVDPLSFASAEGSPDGLVSSITDHSEVWLFGTNSVEVWYNAGTPDFPLQRIQGAFNEIGCAAAYSVAKMDNGLFWLGADARGRGIVYRANGYTGTRISTHAIEWQIQQYGDISDAIGYTYQQDGHSFYVLTFPSGNATWVYDVSTQAWHERAGFSQGQFTRHWSNCQMAFNNEIVVGDYQNGKIYAFDLDVYADAGQIQRWLRSWRALPTGQNDLKRTAHHSLQLDAESGHYLAPTAESVNLITEDGQWLITESYEPLVSETNVLVNRAPQFMLRWSDDGGHTWSNEHWAGGGAVGAYNTRIFWRRLGMTLKLRDRVYELSGTDPIKIAIMGAELILSPTDA
jgi:hypothetical protein